MSLSHFEEDVQMRFRAYLAESQGRTMEEIHENIHGLLDEANIPRYPGAGNTAQHLYSRALYMVAFIATRDRVVKDLARQHKSGVAETTPDP